jgi:dihydrofolate reductase
MRKVFLDVSISVDGFIAHADNDPGALHEWIFTVPGEGFSPRGVNKAVFDEFAARPGAIIVGRRTFDAGEEPWGPEPPFRCPVFVLTHRPRETVQFPNTSYTFVTDGLDAALSLAREAAGDRDIGLMGGSVARQCLAVGVLDEIELHVVPVIFGDGIPLFEAGSLGQVALERTRLVEGDGVTHLRFNVKH